LTTKYNKQFYIDRLEREGWGKVNNDDRYYSDEDLYDSFQCFAHYAYSYLNLPAPSRAQLELLDFASDRSNPHRMLMCLRGLSKSLSAQLYTTWRLLNDPDEHILVMSATGERAKNFTQFVQKLLALLPVCHSMKPRHNKERTSGQSFDVAGATASDSPSVYAVGVENQIAGFRATIVIYDDIESAQNSSSITSKEKIDHYASEAANLLMSGRDETLTLCTPHSKDSIYSDWIANKGFKHLVIPAEYPENIDVYGGGLAPYIVDRLANDSTLVGRNVDERFTPEILRSKMLRIGKSQYQLQYMLNVSESDELKHPLKLSDLIVMDVDIDDAPVKVSPSSMKENMVFVKHNGFKTDRLYSPSFVSQDRARYNYKVLSIDPSGRGTDETGVTVGFSHNGKIYIKKIVGLIGGYDTETMEEIAQMCSDYSIDYIVVESNFGDGAYTKFLEPFIIKKSPNTEIVETRSSTQKEKRIISTIEPLLNQRRLVVDKQLLDDDFKSDVIRSFTYQLTRITKESGCLKHDDRLDSVEMLCKFIIEKEEFSESENSSQFDDTELEDAIEVFKKNFNLNRSRLNYSNRF
jgi:hypothetical protein